MLDGFNDYAAAIILVATAAKVPVTIARWRMAAKCYGRVRVPLARSLLVYVMRSAHGVVLLGTVILVAITAMGEVRLLVQQDPYPRALYLAALLWSCCFVAARLCPPFSVFLASSDRRGVEERGWFAFGSRRYRLLSFLAPREHIDPLAFQAFFGDDIRVRRGVGWRTPVYHLSDVVPLVIADIRSSSSNVEEEVVRLVENGLGSKLRFLADEPLPQWLERLYGTTGSRAVRIDGESLEGILSGWDPAYDLEGRQNLQDEYTSLFREIPSAARPNLPPKEGQVTAMAILDREYSRFLKAHKALEMSELGDRLIEELPSVSSRQAEDEYLESNRGLQIAEGICRGIREGLATERSTLAAFQVASLENKLGKLNRFRRNWSRALEHLRCAQEVLRKIRSAGGVEIDPRIVLSELSDALFLEGEVWTVQYLDAPSDEKKSQGLRCLREAFEVDQSLHRDDPAVRLRIQRLA